MKLVSLIAAMVLAGCATTHNHSRYREKSKCP